MSKDYVAMQLRLTPVMHERLKLAAELCRTNQHAFIMGRIFAGVDEVFERERRMRRFVEAQEKVQLDAGLAVVQAKVRGMLDEDASEPKTVVGE